MLYVQMQILMMTRINHYVWHKANTAFHKKIIPKFKHGNVVVWWCADALLPCDLRNLNHEFCSVPKNS